MARQKGLIKFKGAIGDIIFYKSKDGYMARERGGIDGNRIANDPKFQRTRENGSEFGRAGKSGKILRNAFRNSLLTISDGQLSNRLVKELLKVIQSDEVNQRGLRNMHSGNVSLLQGFDFNAKAPLANNLYAAYTALIDRETGAFTVNIPTFQPSAMVAAPSGTTHFKINCAACAVDFELLEFEDKSDTTDFIPWDATDTVPIALENQLQANATVPLFLAVGIAFYQQINGQMYPLKNGAFNSLCIVKAENSL